MAKRIIEVHYHPAIKEVKFKTEDGKPFEPDQLKKWQYDKFVLQEHGEDFFDSISDALDDADRITLNFYGTQADSYEFCEMVRFYNESKEEKKFVGKPCGVLLSMDEMYIEAEKFGVSAVEKLKQKLKELDRAGGSNQIKVDFKAELNTYIGQIDTKIDSLKSTGINICFVGTYSAGKSSLINAILGEKILPEEDESKTAKFYIINGLASKESESICFDLDDDETLVKWNGVSLELTDKGGQSGSHPLRKTIMGCIKQNSGEEKHKQFYALLDLLNGEDCVGVKIRVKYPIPMNTSSMSFTIYDTPGTGGNNSRHKAILEEAVKEQSHSIVVFVSGVRKIEGEGNSLLLQILNGENKSSFDLDRSLYVINLSDTTTKNKLIKYREETIKLWDSADVEDVVDKEAVEAKLMIPLKDKKLFFTSAAQAYAAKAKKAEIADDDDDEHWDRLTKYPFFEFNKYGNSEAATERIRLAAEQAMRNAGDEYDKAYIITGLFSLVEAIKEYGKKYVMPSKVNVLVSTVEDIFDNLKKAAQVYEDMCGTKIDELQRDLEIINGCISDAINKEYEKNVPQKKEGRWVLDESERKNAGIDTLSVRSITDDIRNRVAEDLRQMQNDRDVKNAKWLDDNLSLLGTNFAGGVAERKLKREIDNDCVDDKKIALALKTGLTKYIKAFNAKQKEAVTKKQKDFKEAVISVIEKNGDLTQAAKDYLKQGLGKKPFDDAVVDDYTADVSEIVRDCVEEKGIWIFAKEVVDTSKLLKDIKDLVSGVLAEKTQEFTKSFCDNLDKVMKDVKANFKENAEGYSVRVQDIKKTQGQVSEIAAETRKVAKELDVLLKDLIILIWKGIANE